jgi:hypothetical protein
MTTTEKYTAWFRIRVAMLIGFSIGAMLSTWGSVASVLITAGLTALVFGAVMGIVVLCEYRVHRRNWRTISEPISHVKVR